MNYSKVSKIVCNLNRGFFNLEEKNSKCGMTLGPAYSNILVTTLSYLQIFRIFAKMNF